MSSPQSLKFDLDFLSYLFLIFYEYSKNQIKNNQMQIWVNLKRIYANDQIFEKFLHQRAWNPLWLLSYFLRFFIFKISKLKIKNH
jgi:hypothetical protein